jgi:hypothetical protein
MTTHLYTIARLEFTAAARLNWTRVLSCSASPSVVRPS